MRVTLEPQFEKTAQVRVPSSKSLSHRALIAAALAEGTSHLYGINMSQDIAATMQAMRSCGARFEEKDGVITVTKEEPGNTRQLSVDCGESGSTLRFLIPLAALKDTPVSFIGHGRLMERPQSVYEKIFRSQNLTFERSGSAITVKGPLKPGAFRVKGDVSSQFISGLLFALPLLEGDSKIIVEPPFESSAYVTLTLDVLKTAGIEIEQDGYVFSIRGNQTYRAADIQVDGDDSQAAFFAVLAMTAGIPVQIHGISHDSHQPDHVIFDLIRQAGAQVTQTEDGYLVEPGKLRAFEADLSGCPDLGPVLFALAAAADGTSVFTNAGRLRIKESDRIESMRLELEKLGCRMTADGDTVRVSGMRDFTGGVTLNSRNDHRIVMALSVLCAKMKNPVMIEGAQAVAKSWPDFFEVLSGAGMKVTYD